jgi:hypothetical protein
MASVHKHPNSPYWSAVFRDRDKRWRRRTTKMTEHSQALELAMQWESEEHAARPQKPKVEKPLKISIMGSPVADGDDAHFYMVRAQSSLFVAGKTIFKIGITSRPEGRMSQLDRGLPFQITISMFVKSRFASSIEKFWKEQLCGYRVGRSTEWFAFPSGSMLNDLKREIASELEHGYPGHDRIYKRRCSVSARQTWERHRRRCFERGIPHLSPENSWHWWENPPSAPA